MFDPSKFCPTESPDLIGGVGGNPSADKFVAEFGDKWRRTPIKGVWFIKSNQRDVIVTIRGDEMALYLCSWDYFKAHWYDGIDAMYFETGEFKHRYLSILKRLRELEGVGFPTFDQ
jgi:hypothetical protein